ncbi:hypothetical protein CYMTET_7407 [Cymbomonas tetramitiformis]|uniref:Uncharacterized protein n=1 Tax=Cymbomonas tetramitiformis TaxID=36881 RepID=A0AAE0GV70_9CHLO|nr:hypothetical protein CYMTET_7407 [Cymbomonas tetramitiformis]
MSEKKAANTNQQDRRPMRRGKRKEEDEEKGGKGAKSRGNTGIAARCGTAAAAAAATTIAGCGEGERLTNGGLTKAMKRSLAPRELLVPKPGTHKWRLVVEFRRLNFFSVKSTVKMEMLKELGQLAEQSNGCLAARTGAACAYSGLQQTVEMGQWPVLSCASSPYDKGGVKVESLQPHLPAITNYHEDMGCPGPAKGRAVVRDLKGAAAPHVGLSLQQDDVDTQRTWLPARHARMVHHAVLLQLYPSSAYKLQLPQVYVHVTFVFL